MKRRAASLARLRRLANGVDIGLGNVLREKSSRRIAARAVVIGRPPVHGDGRNRISDGEPLSTGRARACVAGSDNRLLTNGSEVIVTTTVSIAVHLGHRLNSRAESGTDVEQVQSRRSTGFDDRIPRRVKTDARHGHIHARRSARFRGERRSRYAPIGCLRPRIGALLWAVLEGDRLANRATSPGVERVCWPLRPRYRVTSMDVGGPDRLGCGHSLATARDGEHRGRSSATGSLRRRRALVSTTATAIRETEDVFESVVDPPRGLRHRDD